MRIPFLSRRPAQTSSKRSASKGSKASEQLPPEIVHRIERWMKQDSDAFPDEQTVHAIRLERREGLRQAMDVLRVRAVVRVVGAGSMGQEFVGGVRDVSGEGLSLLLEQPVETDSQLRVVIQPASDGTGGAPQQRITIRCTTCWCRRDEVAGGWVVGCRVGVEWTDALFDLMLPADGNRRVA